MKTETTSNSATSLTLGILSILIPLIGLVLGVIGVVVSRKTTKEMVKTNEDGRGLVTAGFICSVIGIIIQLFAVLGLISYYSIKTVY